MNKVIARLKNQTKNNASLTISRDFHISESYTSLLLGIAVVLFVAFFFVSFVKNRKPEVISTPVVKPEVISQEMQKVKQNKEAEVSYTVVEGDTLWSIAETHYGSGYQWADIAKANNIADPSLLEAGTALVFPKEDAKILASSTIADSATAPISDQQQTNAIADKSYTVKPGDDLWDIAIRAYGDGYRWPDIAKANSLADPDIIHSGNVLTIPR